MAHYTKSQQIHEVAKAFIQLASSSTAYPETIAHEYFECGDARGKEIILHPIGPSYSSFSPYPDREENFLNNLYRYPGETKDINYKIIKNAQNYVLDHLKDIDTYREFAASVNDIRKVAQALNIESTVISFLAEKGTVQDIQNYLSRNDKNKYVCPKPIAQAVYDTLQDIREGEKEPVQVFLLDKTRDEKDALVYFNSERFAGVLARIHNNKEWTPEQKEELQKTFIKNYLNVSHDYEQKHLISCAIDAIKYNVPQFIIESRNARDYMNDEKNAENGVFYLGKTAIGIVEGAQEITIKDGTTNIGNNAFRLCYGLTNITIPDSVTSIGEGAFEGCEKLTSIVIPDNVRRISDSTFENCSGLTNITIPDNVTSIGNYAFRGCTGLTSITIPDSVTSIGHEAFHGRINLTNITVDENNKVYDSRNNCNAIIETATNTLIRGCKNTIIPDDITKIDENAFYFCTDLTSITIPDSVIDVDEHAFYGCDRLKSISAPARLAEDFQHSGFYITKRTDTTISQPQENGIRETVEEMDKNDKEQIDHPSSDTPLFDSADIGLRDKIAILNDIPTNDTPTNDDRDNKSFNDEPSL